MLQAKPTTTDTMLFALEPKSPAPVAAGGKRESAFSDSLDEQMGRIKAPHEARPGGAKEDAKSASHEASESEANQRSEAGDGDDAVEEPLQAQPGADESAEEASVDAKAEADEADGKMLPLPFVPFAAMDDSTAAGSTVPATDNAELEEDVLAQSLRLVDSSARDGQRGLGLEQGMRKQGVTLQDRAFVPLADGAGEVDAEQLADEDVQLEELPKRLLSLLQDGKQSRLGQGESGFLIKGADLPGAKEGEGLLLRGSESSGVVASQGSNAGPRILQPQGVAGSMFTVEHGVQQKGWDQAVGQRVVWMVRQNLQEAQIQLNPRSLGPVEVKVSVSQEQASVQFTVQHAATREALEAALPRLREMLNEQGLNLAHSDVSQHSQQQEADGEGAGGGGQGTLNADAAPDQPDEMHATMVPTPQDNGVDYYA